MTTSNPAADDSPLGLILVDDPADAAVLAAVVGERGVATFDKVLSGQPRFLWPS